MLEQSANLNGAILTLAVAAGQILELNVHSFLCIWMCGDLHMSTNLALDPKLVDQALEVSGERTKKAAVTKALQEFVARRRQKRLLDLMGKLEWDNAYDYKAERSRN